MYVCTYKYVFRPAARGSGMRCGEGGESGGLGVLGNVCFWTRRLTDACVCDLIIDAVSLGGWRGARGWLQEQ
jgi:hypothetical protein